MLYESSIQPGKITKPEKYEKSQFQKPYIDPNSTQNELPAIKDDVIKQSMQNLNIRYDPNAFRTPAQDARKEGMYIPLKNSMSKKQRDDALTEFYRGKKMLTGQNNNHLRHSATVLSSIKKPMLTVQPRESAQDLIKEEDQTVRLE